MEILSNSVFHGETTFKKHVTFEESEIHMSDVAFSGNNRVSFNGEVLFSCSTCVSFNNGLTTDRLYKGYSNFLLPGDGTTTGPYTLATTSDLSKKVDQFIISVPAVAADCSIFKLVNQGHGGDIPLSIQMFKKDTTICSSSSNGFWTPVQADLYTDRSMGLCEIIVKKSSSFEIESGSYEIRATYYRP